MALYVRDEKVRELASKLAERRGCSVTDAVRGALNEALHRDEERVKERLKALNKILAEFDSAPELRPGFTDKDLYDEDGLPIL